VNPNLPVGGSAFDLGLGARDALPESLTLVSLTTIGSVFLSTYEGSKRIDDPARPSITAIVGTLDLRHHFGGGWSAGAALPIGTVAYDPGIERPIQRFSGFGDLLLTGSYDLAALFGAGGYNPSVRVDLSLGLPSGTQQTLGGPNVPPNLLSIGNATWSLGGRLAVTQFVAKWLAFEGAFQGTAPIGRTAEGVRFGGRLGYDLGAVILPSDDFALFAQLAGEHRGHADEEEEGTVVSSGGHVLAAQVAASLRIGERLTVGLGARVPVFVRAGGTQLAETYTLFGTIAIQLGGEADHDHAHDHGDEHGESIGEPAVDLATGGDSFAMAGAPIPGKVTVVDFWAEWCAPCKAIDALLADLAAHDPDLAVRRVEVPDFDSAVAREHLAGVAALPVVWIFDRDGHLIERIAGASPDDVRRKVERALATGPQGQPKL
jgi:thioredoxin 1